MNGSEVELIHSDGSTKLIGNSIALFPGWYWINEEEETAVGPFGSREEALIDAEQC